MPSKKVERVSVIGLGKLGLCLAAVLASRGFEVSGVETDESKVNAVNRGISPIYEPGLGQMIRKNRKKLRAATSYDAISRTDVTFVVVPTPSDESGAFSLKFVTQAMESIGKEVAKKRTYHLVVLTSTVMPGSMDRTVVPLLEKASGRTVGKDFGVCYNPEFIALGDVIHGLLRPDFILIGESDPKAGKLLSSIQKRICENSPPIERMNFVNAEIAKISVNSYVTMKMTFANTLAEISENVPGADVDVITRALGRDKRIGGAYLKGALGYGGTCLAEGTMIQTKEGLRPIETLSIGDEVLSHDGLYHRVTQTFARDYSGIAITIVPEGGIPVTVTPEHPILSSPRVLDESLRYLDLPERKGTDGYVRNGHRLRSMTGLQLLPLSWQPAFKIKHGDLVPYPIPRFPLMEAPVLDFRPYHQRAKRSKLPLQQLLTADIARLIGYYVSEGSTWQKEVTFSLHRGELGIIEDLKRLIRSLGYRPRLKKKSANGVDVVFSCAPLARFLRAVFGGNASNKRLPANWLGLTFDLKLELLRGVMYGDGSTSQSYYTFGVTSRQLANQVFLMFLSLGVGASFQMHGRYLGRDGVFHKDSFFVRARRSKDIARLSELLPTMPISSDRITETKSTWIENGFLYRHVRRVFNLNYRGKVYNLEVENANSYCSEGAILHNCFPRDNVAFKKFAESVGAQARLAEATHEVNVGEVKRIVDFAMSNGLEQTRKVGVLGLSFKPNTNIVEQSQSLLIAKELTSRGFEVNVYDPAAMGSARSELGAAVNYRESLQDCVGASDFVIVATPWDEFKKLNLRLLRGKVVLDCWRVLPAKIPGAKVVRVGVGMK